MLVPIRLTITRNNNNNKLPSLKVKTQCLVFSDRVRKMCDANSQLTTHNSNTRSQEMDCEEAEEARWLRSLARSSSVL